MCKEHKAEPPNQTAIYTMPITIGEGSPAGDLYMVLCYIRESFRYKPLPGMEKVACSIETLDDERLSALIRIVLKIQCGQADLDEFMQHNGLE